MSTAPTPSQVLAAVKNGSYPLKHVQDVSMLYIHHYLLLTQPALTIADRTATALAALPEKWNHSPNMVFLRYGVSNGEGGKGLLTLRFGKKENGGMDLHLKSTLATATKSIKVKSTFTKTQLGGGLTNSGGLDVDQLVATSPAIIGDLTATLSEILDFFHLATTATATTTPSTTTTPQTTTTATTTTAPVKVDYFLHARDESIPLPQQPQPLSSSSTTTATTTTTTASRLQINSHTTVPIITASGMPGDHIIGDSKGFTPTQPINPATAKPTLDEPPQPLVIKVPQVERGLNLPTDYQPQENDPQPPFQQQHNNEHQKSELKVNPPPSTLPAGTGPQLLPPTATSPTPGSRPTPNNPTMPFDPYSGEMNPGRMTDRGFRGGMGLPFADDPFQGGNLMGPGQFGPGGGGFRGGPGPAGGGFGGGGPDGFMPPPGGARFDPFGPVPGMGGLNNDHLRRPGPQDPRNGRGGNNGINGPNNGNFNGYF